MPPPDPDNWQAWLAPHKAALFLMARQHLANTQEAEDAVQEGFIKFWNSRHTARDPAAYLFACVRTAAIDLRRARTARDHREKRPHAPEPPLFQSALEHNESRQQIEAALGRVPADQREVLILKIWGGLTFAQIAATLHIPQSTAASRHRYALDHLQALLAPGCTMSDNDLEQLLHQLKPTEPGHALDARIASALTHPAAPRDKLSLADRCLLTTLSAGLIAACLIVTLLTLESMNAPTSAPPARLADAPTALNTQRPSSPN